MNSFTLDEIYVGQKASVTKTITRGDIYAFAGLVDDTAPSTSTRRSASRAPSAGASPTASCPAPCSAPWRAITCQAQAASMCARA